MIFAFLGKGAALLAFDNSVKNTRPPKSESSYLETMAGIALNCVISPYGSGFDNSIFEFESFVIKLFRHSSLNSINDLTMWYE